MTCSLRSVSQAASVASSENKRELTLRKLRVTCSESFFSKLRSIASTSADKRATCIPRSRDCFCKGASFQKKIQRAKAKAPAISTAARRRKINSLRLKDRGRAGARGGFGTGGGWPLIAGILRLK